MAHPTLTEVQVIAKAILQLTVVVGYGNELHQHLFAMLPEAEQDGLKRAAAAIAEVTVEATPVAPAPPADPVVA